jgi:rhodanese-related sulfurtransferase
MRVELGEALLEHAPKSTVRPVTRTLDDLFAAAADRIRRYTPAEAHVAGLTLVDIRSQDSRERDGAIPGAYHVPRSVLEWRLASETWRNTALDDKTVVLVCDDGYSSVLAAATLVEVGRDAGDVIGGFAAWKAAGLPVTEARRYDGLAGTGPPD